MPSPFSSPFRPCNTIALAPGLVLAVACAASDGAERASSAAAGAAPPPSLAGPVALSPEALAVHRSAIVVDGHNDLPWALRARASSSFDQVDIAKPQERFHTDIPRLRQGGLGAQFWSVFVPASSAGSGDALRLTLEQIDLVHRMVRRYPETFEMASTADDVERIHAQGRIACLMGVEGGYSIEGSLAVLRMLHELGVRYMTLTHSDTIEWADSATDEPRHGGLSPFGEEVVREMNAIGMLVDLSHVSVETMEDALRVSRAPVIFSHSSARALADHPRNVPDEILRKVAGNGGVVMVNFFSGFVVEEAARIASDMFDVMRRLEAETGGGEGYRAAMRAWREEHPMPRGTVRDVADHIDHVARVAGIDHVGLGSDYDGVSLLPEQLDDVSAYPYLTQELQDRGYTAEEIHKVLGGNVLRALRRAEEVAGG